MYSMLDITDEEFQHLIDKALTELPGDHAKNIKNVAILYEDAPTPEQRTKLALRNDQTLLGFTLSHWLTLVHGCDHGQVRNNGLSRAIGCAY